MPAPAWSRSAGRAASARRAARVAGDERDGRRPRARELRLAGGPAARGDPGRRARSASGSGPARRRPGSCIAVVATDAPLDGAQLERLARRAGLGLARTGLGRPRRERRDLPRLLDRARGVGAAAAPSPTGQLDAILRGRGRGDRGGRAERALGGRRHDRPRGPARAGAAAGAGPRAPARGTAGSDATSRPERMMPQINQTPKMPEMHEARRTRSVDARSAAALFALTTPRIDDPTRPPATISAIAMRLMAWSMCKVSSSMPGLRICTSSRPWRVCSTMSRIW